MNSFGNNLKLTVFGGSHSKELGCTIEGLPAGKSIDMRAVNRALLRRSAKMGGMGSTLRHEADIANITSGIEGDPFGIRVVTDGSPLTAVFANNFQNRNDYCAIARPSHADYVQYKKHGSEYDLSGGGQASGRMTLPLVFAGAVCAGLLALQGINIVSHVLRIGKVCDKRFDPMQPALAAEADGYFPLVDNSVKPEMQQAIAAAKESGDTLSCECECAVTGLPVGLGEPFFNGLESMLSHLLFAIPGLHGVEFGEHEHTLGSAMNDCFTEGGATTTNHSGGINGGMANGMPMVFRCWFRPIPSISLPQTGYDLINERPVPLTVTGRHDVCILPRGCVVVESAASICICDFMRDLL